MLIGWREALLLAVVIVAAFLGYSLYRLIRAPLSAPARPEPAPATLPGYDAGPEFARLQREIERLREDVERLKAARNVSPQYHDALSLAQQGLDADAVAERCGISVAEAELVCALARGEK